MDSPDLGALPVRFRWAQAHDAGVSQRELRRARALGLVRRPAYGVYARSRPLAEGQPWQLVRDEHLARCADLLMRFPGHAASHMTAAVIHGLDPMLHPAQDVHLTSVDRVPRSRRVDGAQLHHADSIANDTIVVHGLRVTTVARTLADVLRTARPPHSVAVLDIAVRAGHVTAAEVAAVLDRQVRWRGRPRARAALTQHDARRESWLESYSFVTLHQRGIPLPLAQVDVLDEGFHFVGRVDGLLAATATVLEADGAEKYLLAARDGAVDEQSSIELTTRAQQARHGRLVGLGLTVARWTTDEIMHADEVVAARVRTAMRGGDPRRFTGWLRYGGGHVRIGELQGR